MMLGDITEMDHTVADFAGTSLAFDVPGRVASKSRLFKCELPHGNIGKSAR